MVTCWAGCRADYGHHGRVIARRVGRFLERQWPLERDAQNSFLADDG